MKTWLTALFLLVPCNGCMMLEDMMFDDAPSSGYPAYQTAVQHPPGTCGMNVTNVAASQTAEPELLQVRK
jgi:hypothetical protein